jgi:hypothetical protein
MPSGPTVRLSGTAIERPTRSRGGYRRKKQITELFSLQLRLGRYLAAAVVVGGVVAEIPVPHRAHADLKDHTVVT